MEAIYYLIPILLLLGVVIYYVLKGSGSKSDPVMQQHFMKITAETNVNDFNSLKNAIFELDKLLDRLLKNKKIKGETLGERLKNAGFLFNNEEYNRVWEAHKIRNILAHEVNPNIDLKTLQYNYKNFRQILSKHI